MLHIIFWIFWCSNEGKTIFEFWNLGICLFFLMVLIGEFWKGVGYCKRRIFETCWIIEGMVYIFFFIVYIFFFIAVPWFFSMHVLNCQPLHLIWPLLIYNALMAPWLGLQIPSILSWCKFYDFNLAKHVILTSKCYNVNGASHLDILFFIFFNIMSLLISIEASTEIREILLWFLLSYNSVLWLA